MRHRDWEPCSPAEDQLLVAALAADWSCSQAADMAGVMVEDVMVRMSDLVFAQTVAVRRTAIRQTAVAMTLLESEDADRIRQILVDLAGIDLLVAATVVLDWSLRHLRGDDLAVRVAELRPFLGCHRRHGPIRPII